MKIHINFYRGQIDPEVLIIIKLKKKKKKRKEKKET